MGELLRCKYTCRLLSEAGETGGGPGTISSLLVRVPSRWGSDMIVSLPLNFGGLLCPRGWNKKTCVGLSQKLTRTVPPIRERSDALTS